MNKRGAGIVMADKSDRAIVNSRNVILFSLAWLIALLAFGAQTSLPATASAIRLDDVVDMTLAGGLRLSRWGLCARGLFVGVVAASDENSFLGVIYIKRSAVRIITVRGRERSSDRSDCAAYQSVSDLVRGETYRCRWK